MKFEIEEECSRQPESVSFLVHGVEGLPVTPGHCGHRQDPLLADGGVVPFLGNPIQDFLQEAILKQAVLGWKKSAQPWDQ